jgi:DNA-binding LytR/AlgR family response regulator
LTLRGDTLPRSVTSFLQQLSKKKFPEGHIPTSQGTNIQFSQSRNIKTTTMKRLPTDMIGLITTDGFTLVDVGDIVCCIADGSYTTIQLANGKSHKLSKSLAKIEEALPSDLFIRIHHHYLVNKLHVKEYKKNGGPKFLLLDGQWVPVAERRRKSVLGEFRLL